MAESGRRVVYYKGKDASGKDVTNQPVDMYAIDAHNAVGLHPDEYSFTPWDGSEGPNLPGGELRPIVPSDWIDMKPSEKLTLARQLGAENIRSGAAAEDFIMKYLTDRANAAPSSGSTTTTVERPEAQAREVQRSATLEVQEGRSSPEAVSPARQQAAATVSQDAGTLPGSGSTQDKVDFAQPAAGSKPAK